MPTVCLSLLWPLTSGFPVTNWRVQTWQWRMVTPRPQQTKRLSTRTYMLYKVNTKNSIQHSLCIVYNWNNDSYICVSPRSLSEKSFRECLLSRLFIWHLVWLSVMQLRHYLFISTLNPMLQKLTGGEPSLGNTHYFTSLSQPKNLKKYISSTSDFFFYLLR